MRSFTYLYKFSNDLQADPVGHHRLAFNQGFEELWWSAWWVYGMNISTPKKRSRCESTWEAFLGSGSQFATVRVFRDPQDRFALRTALPIFCFISVLAVRMLSWWSLTITLLTLRVYLIWDCLMLDRAIESVISSLISLVIPLLAPSYWLDQAHRLVFELSLSLVW